MKHTGCKSGRAGAAAPPSILVSLAMGQICPFLTRQSYKDETCPIVEQLPVPTIFRGVSAQRAHSGGHMAGKNWGVLLQLAIFLPIQILHPHNVRQSHVSPHPQPQSHPRPRIVTSTLQQLLVQPTQDVPVRQPIPTGLFREGWYSEYAF